MTPAEEEELVTLAGQRRSDSRPDEDLVAAGLGVDTQALGVLCLRHYRLGLQLAYRCTGSIDAAEDVLHDTLTGLLEALPERTIRGPFRKYFCTAIRNKAATWCRNQEREKLRTKDLGSEDQLHIVPAGKGAVGHLLDVLSTAHRQVLEERYLQGLTVAEVAAAHALPEGTVKSRRDRALRSLRKVFGESQESRDP